MRSRDPALAVFAALAAWPTAASAAEQTFCVSDPTCVGTNKASVADALAAAQANGSERDRIKVGPGTFPATATLSDALNNPVLIEGAGESVLAAASDSMRMPMRAARTRNRHSTSLTRSFAAMRPT